LAIIPDICSTRVANQTAISTSGKPTIIHAHNEKKNHCGLWHNNMSSQRNLIIDYRAGFYARTPSYAGSS
jgi:hypothetical protein